MLYATLYGDKNSSMSKSFSSSWSDDSLSCLLDKTLLLEILATCWAYIYSEVDCS